MMKIKLLISDIIIKIISPFDFSFSDNFNGFITNKSGYDLLIELVQVDKLEQLVGKEKITDLDAMTSIYYIEKMLIQVFKTGIKGMPYAYCYHCFNQKRIVVKYLKEYEKNIVNISSFVNLIGIENIISYFNEIILHSSLIEYEGNGIVFMGASGVGKSTRAQLWNTYADAEIINGDRTILRKIENNWFGYGSPYSGSSGIYKNLKCKLKAIILVKRDNDNVVCLERLMGLSAVKEVYKNITVPAWNLNYLDDVFDMIEDIVLKVPVYQFICPPDERVVKILMKELRL